MNPGETYPSIAALFGVSESMVYRICKKHGISRYKTDVNDVDQPQTVTAEMATVVETGKIQNLQNLSESPLGVPSEGLRGSYSDTYLPDPGLSVEGVHGEEELKQDGLVQAYMDLYASVTKKRKRRRQMPGQLGFRIAPDGTVEYYVIA